MEKIDNSFFQTELKVFKNSQKKTMGAKSSKDSLSEEDLNLLVSSTNISAEEIQVNIYVYPLIQFTIDKLESQRSPRT